MPEWSKGLHLSCNIFGCVGSNPTPDKLSAWRNWIARKTSNLKVVGSSPTVDFFLTTYSETVILLKINLKTTSS